MNFEKVITTKAENRWFLLVGLIGMTFGLIGSILEIYAIALIPIAMGLMFLSYQKPGFFALLICFLVPMSIFVDDVGGGLGLSIPTEPMIWLLFIQFIYWALINGQLDTRLLKTPLMAFILLNLGWMVITSLTSTMPLVSMKYLLARFWFVSVFFFFMLLLFRNQNFMRRYLSYMLYGTFLVVGFTLIKHSAEGFSRGWGYAIMKPFFTDHTIYSAYISFFVPVAFMFAFRGNWFKFGFWHRLFFLFIALVLIVGIVFSYTRASWISLIGALAFYQLIRFKVKFKHIIGALCLIAAIGFIKQEQILYSLESNKQGSADDLESHAESVSNITTDPSNLERVNRWHCAILMFRDKPVFGFGPGTYTFKYATYQRPEDLTIISTHSGDLGNTHSEYFNAMSEMGLLGLLTWLGVFLASIYTGLQIVHSKTKMHWQKSMATAAMLGLVTYYIHAFLNNFSDFDKIAAPLWGFMAILVAISYYDYGKAKTSKLVDEKVQA